MEGINEAGFRVRDVDAGACCRCLRCTHAGAAAAPRRRRAGGCRTAATQARKEEPEGSCAPEVTASGTPGRAMMSGLSHRRKSMSK